MPYWNAILLLAKLAHARQTIDGLNRYALSRPFMSRSRNEADLLIRGWLGWELRFTEALAHELDA